MYQSARVVHVREDDTHTRIVIVGFELLTPFIHKYLGGASKLPHKCI